MQGAEVLARSGFAGGGGAPLQVVVPEAGRADAVAEAVGRLDGVARVGEPERGEPGARLDVGLAVDPFGERALALVPEVRRAAGEATRGRSSAARPPRTTTRARRPSVTTSSSCPRRSRSCC